MNNWKHELQKALEAGQKPSYDLLEAAVLGAISERKAMQMALQNMTYAMTNIFTAYLGGDPAKLAAVIATYMAVRTQLSEGAEVSVPASSD